MKDDIRNNNTKGELHGYQEWYYSNGEFYLRGVWKNGQLHRYQEWHDIGNKQTEYHIK